MRLVDDEGVGALRQLADLLSDKGEFLQGRDDDGSALGEGSGELVGVFVDALDHPGLVLKLVDSVLKLLVEHEAVGDHHHRVEHFTVAVVMQALQPVRQPGNGVGFATAGRVLDQIVVAWALSASRSFQLTHAVELVVTRKNERCAALLPAVLLALQVQEAGDDVEQAVPL